MFIYTAPAFASMTGNYTMLLMTGPVPLDPQTYADLTPYELFAESNALLGCDARTSPVNSQMIELTKDLDIESPSTKEPYFYEPLDKCILPINKFDVEFEDSRPSNLEDIALIQKTLHEACSPSSSYSTLSLDSIPATTTMNIELVDPGLVLSFQLSISNQSFIANSVSLEYFDGTDWVFIFEDHAMTTILKYDLPEAITAQKFRISYARSGYSSAVFTLSTVLFMADAMPTSFTEQGSITHAVILRDSPRADAFLLDNYDREIPIYQLEAGGPYDGKPVSISTDTPDPEIELGLLNCRFGNSLMETK